MESTKYNDHEEFLKKTLANKGVYFFGPMLKHYGKQLQKEPWTPPQIGALEPNPEPPVAAVPNVPQRTEPTPLMSGPTDLVDRVSPAMRQFTVAMPGENGLQLALRVTLEPNGDLLVQGPMRDYAVKILKGRSLVGGGVESGAAGFYQLANTVWGPSAQVFKVNVD